MFVKSNLYFLVACALFICANANSVSTDIEECPLVCPLLLSPVCATNGRNFKEFANDCLLKASNCRLERSALKKYSLTAMDFCGTEMFSNFNQLLVKFDNLDITLPECLKPCAMIYSPVCISNGKYRAVVSNKCVLETFNCVLAKKGLESFRVLQQGDKCEYENNVNDEILIEEI